MDKNSEVLIVHYWRKNISVAKDICCIDDNLDVLLPAGCETRIRNTDHIVNRILHEVFVRGFLYNNFSYLDAVIILCKDIGL